MHYTLQRAEGLSPASGELDNAAALTIPLDPIHSKNGEQGLTHSDANPPAEPTSHGDIELGQRNPRIARRSRTGRACYFSY